MSALLEIDSIRRDFGLKQILTDISLTCRTGDIVGLLGRNGSGKSTLLKIIFGTLPTDNKFIRLDGQVLEKPFKSRSIGYLSQDSFLPKSLTVDQVFDIYAPHLDEKGFFDDEILSKVRDVRVRNLSGGEARYLEVKLILNLDCLFVLLDEPFNGLSPVHIDIVKEMVSSKSVSRGIILTDHDYRNVLDVAKRCYLLFDGGLKVINKREDLASWGYIP